MTTIFTWFSIKHAVGALLRRLREAQRRMQARALRDRIAELTQLKHEAWYTISQVTPELQDLEKRLFVLERVEDCRG